MERQDTVDDDVQEVAIPTILLRNLGVNTDELWTPVQNTIFSSPSYLPSVVRKQKEEVLAKTSRAQSVSIAALGRRGTLGLDVGVSQSNIAGERSPRATRKTSVPITRRDVLGIDHRGASPMTIFEAPESTDDAETEGLDLDRKISTSSSQIEPLDTSPAKTPKRLSNQHSFSQRKESTPAMTTWQSRRQTLITAPVQRAMSTFALAAQTIRKSSIFEVYEEAKRKGQNFQRTPWVQTVFEFTFYAILIAFVYFVLVGRPLWNGAVWWLYWVVDHKFVIRAGFTITLSIAAFYSFGPLLVLFEQYPSPQPEGYDPAADPKIQDTALLIPCYKSAQLIANTLEAALKIFPPEHIYVIANGNSPTPLDNTEEVCRPYAVNHVWSPVGSKIVAQFVGCYAAKRFKKVLLIDDDCALPSNFPVVTERLTGNIKCLGYTIKSVGPDSSKGTLCQQAQDLEYKISGLQRALAGKIGSATFPHGAISLWDREFLIKTFYRHPGFSVSEDWFFGHVARLLGSRITMCTSIFVETETPSSVFFSSGGARGGFGEMTIFQQRFKRWNFFFVNGIWYNMAYIVGSWKLGWAEFGAKIFVFQEVYETLLYLLTPFVLPISLIVRPSFAGYLLLGTFAMYLVNIIIFNEFHLRRKNERVGSMATYIYYMPYKIVLTAINVVSCYWAIFRYARYFAKRHPKIVDDEHAVEVVLRLEEDKPLHGGPIAGRRMTVTAIETRVAMDESFNLQQNRRGSFASLRSQDRNRMGSYVSFMERITEIDSNTADPGSSGAFRMSFSEKSAGSDPESPTFTRPPMIHVANPQMAHNAAARPAVIKFADPFSGRQPISRLPSIKDAPMSHPANPQMAENVAAGPVVIDFADPFFRRQPMSPLPSIEDAPEQTRKTSMARSMV